MKKKIGTYSLLINFLLNVVIYKILKQDLVRISFFLFNVDLDTTFLILYNYYCLLILVRMVRPLILK